MSNDSPAPVHGHHHDPVPVSPRTERRLLLAVTPFAVATVLGLMLLWPGGRELPVQEAAIGAQERYQARIVGVERGPCDDASQQTFLCSVVEAELTQGPEEGEVIELALAEGVNTRRAQTGDGILVGVAPDAPPEQRYFFLDFQRSNALILLAVIFAAMVIALSRIRGLASLVGLAASLMILVVFVLPAILEGSPPLLVAIVGGSAIMFVTLYLAHGFNAMTTTAVLGTLTSLTITGVLALVFVEAARFSGFASEEAVFLQVAAEQISLQGLLLGSIVIGTLGVLDDVTVTQASAVWELHRANPSLGSLGLYRAGIRIGRNHIASTVNTLVLAYAGATLPLLILFNLGGRPFGDIVTSEIVAEEIVRTLVGSIGLVASVPITTALAALVAAGDEGPKLLQRRRREFRPSRGERFFRTDDEA